MVGGLFRAVLPRLSVLRSRKSSKNPSNSHRCSESLAAFYLVAAANCLVVRDLRGRNGGASNQMGSAGKTVANRRGH